MQWIVRFITYGLVALLLATGFTASIAHDATADRIALLTEETLAYPTEETLTRASEGVVRIDIYRSVPVVAAEYAFTDGRVHLTEEVVGATKVAVSTGSGFFVSRDGYLVTNKHVVAGEGAEFMIDTGAREYPAKVVYRDPVEDLAILKVEGDDFTPLPLGDSEVLAPGDPVVAFGNALGRYTDSTSAGLVIALDQTIVAGDREQSPESLRELSGLIYTSAKIHPGDSGGPLLDGAGRVIGVNVATTVGEHDSFAVPIEHLKAALEAMP